MFVDLGGIIIEDNVLIGPRVNLLSVNHPELPMKRRGVLLAQLPLKICVVRRGCHCFTRYYDW